MAALVYTVALSIESIRDHEAFATGFDTAIYDQLLWLLANGHEPFSTVVSRPMLGDHFQPGLVLLTPLYWLGLGLPGLFVAQSVGLALTGPALFALARAAGASPALASIPAFLWLACPWVVAVNLFEFRPTAFMPCLLVVGVLAAIRDRYVLLAVTSLLALSLKEDVSLIYVTLGALLFVHGKRWMGGILALGSAIWFVGASWIIESLSGSYEAFGQRYAGDRGDSVGDALLWSLEHPVQTVSDIASQSLVGLVVLLLATGGVALLAPSWMLLAAPTALYNALSAYAPQHDLAHHYHLGTLAGLFVAAAVGAARLPALGRLPRLAVTAVISVSVAFAIVGGVRTHANSSMGIGLQPDQIRSVLGGIPPEVPVAAARSLLPHLSQRREIYTLPEPFIQLDWGSSLTPEELAERARRVDFVAYVEGDQVKKFTTDDVEDEAPDARPVLKRLGFVVVARSGPVEILERRR